MHPPGGRTWDIVWASLIQPDLSVAKKWIFSMKILRAVQPQPGPPELEFFWGGPAIQPPAREGGFSQSPSDPPLPTRAFKKRPDLDPPGYVTGWLQIKND